ncbi:hypothetical protein CDD81_6503 [Ophiocordyceps australis]|uniref:Uncharacterized protein n=1 Tax=Ophiocordyceps australis TaxID=1399860 RepID=A0A2C5YG36_9HYPO|nr:hypothetical protein CDD81_6503 [Ophiocordyceps australis]
MTMKYLSVALMALCAQVVVAQGDLGLLDLGELVRNTPKARAVINRLKGNILSKGQPHILYGVRDADSEGCYYMYQPLRSTPEGLDIQIVVNTDRDEISTGSKAATIDTTTSTAKIDTSSTGWRLEDTTNIGADTTVSAGAFGFGASLTISASKMDSSEKSGDQGHTMEFRQDESQTFECPAKTTCTIQTWTFVATLKGTCPEIPTFNSGCFDERLNKFPPTDDDPLQVDELKKFLDGNLTLPSINGQWPIWSRFPQDYYTMTNKDGSPAGKVLPEKKENNLWWPSDKFKVDYRFNPKCEVSSPLYDKSGKPKRGQYLIEYPDEMFVKRDEQNGAPKNLIKITVISENLDD